MAASNYFRLHLAYLTTEGKSWRLNVDCFRLIGRTISRGNRRYRSTSRRDSRRRFGGALVELTLVSPLFVMMLFGTIEYGYFSYVKSEVLTAATNGAHEGALSTSSNATVQSAVDTAMANSNLQNMGYTVTTSPASVAGLSTGTTITVSVSFPWSNMNMNLLPTSLGGIGTGKQVTASVPTVRQQ